MLMTFAGFSPVQKAQWALALCTFGPITIAWGFSAVAVVNVHIVLYEYNLDPQRKQTGT